MADVERIDDLISAVGYGHWQFPVLMATIIVNVIPLHYMVSTLLAAQVSFRCFSQEDASISSISDFNSTGSSWYNDQCLDHKDHISGGDLSNETIQEIHLHRYTTGLKSCPVIEYDTSVFSTTIPSEFALVCEREWMRPLFQMMTTIGAILGSLVAGEIADSFGRKRAMQIGCLIGLPASIGVAFVPWFPLLLLLRIMIGLATRMMILSTVNLAMETCPPHHRTLLGMLMGIPYSLSVILFAVTGYFVRDWRYLQLIVSVPFFVMAPLTLIVNESPRWLVQNGRSIKAAEIMEDAVKKNAVKVSFQFTAYLQKMQEATYESSGGETTETSLRERLSQFVESVRKYLGSPAMLIIIFVTPMMYFLMCILYNGIVYNANNFTSTNPFLYIALLSIFEIISVLLATPINQKIGRRPFVCTSLLLGGLLYLFELFIPDEIWIAKWGLVMLSYFLVGGGYQVLFMYTPELFPTTVRTKGFAMVTLVGSLGQIVAPVVTDLLSQQAWWAVGVSLGCSGLVSGLLVPLLPETRNMPLPETLADVEERRNNGKCKNSKAKAGAVVDPQRLAV